MELRSPFLLYIEYYESKSSQKRIQSPATDIVSFIQYGLQGIGSRIEYRAVKQRCTKN